MSELPDGLPRNCVAWLSLDDADNDPARFAAYWLAAVQQVAPRLGTCLLAGLPTPLTSLQTCLTLPSPPAMRSSPRGGRRWPRAAPATIRL